MRAKKRKRTGCATAFLLFLVFVFVLLSCLSFDLRLPGYKYGVEEYLISQKRKTGVWPSDLKGFSQSPQSSGAEKRYFHRTYFQSMEIIQSDAKSCRFRLHLKGFWGFYPRRSIEEESVATIE